MKDEIAPWFREWLELSTEQKYERAYIEYLQVMPNGSLSDFHLMEIKHWEERIKDPEKYPAKKGDAAWFDVKLAVEIDKLLKYYKAREATNQRGFISNETVIPNRKITHSLVGSFCYLVWCSGIVDKDESESNESYCRRVCSEYSLKYGDRVRQNFSQASKAGINTIKECILPHIPENHSSLILEYLKNK